MNLALPVLQIVAMSVGRDLERRDRKPFLWRGRAILFEPAPRVFLKFCLFITQLRHEGLLRSTAKGSRPVIGSKILGDTASGGFHLDGHTRHEGLIRESVKTPDARGQ